MRDRDPSCQRRSIVIILFVAIISVTRGGFAQEEPQEEPRPSLREYIEAMEQFGERRVEVDGMEVTARIIPDLYRYRFAEAIERGQRNGWTGDKLAKFLDKEHKACRKEAQRLRVHVHIGPAGSKHHLFLQKKPKSHVKVKGGGKLKSVSGGKPKPRFEKWQIIQGASMKRFTLARIAKLDFEIVLEKRKEGGVIELVLAELMHYFEAPKKSVYEAKGINISERQISLGSIRDMIVDPISIEIAPATWSEPREPKALIEWRKRLSPPKQP